MESKHLTEEVHHTEVVSRYLCSKKSHKNDYIDKQTGFLKKKAFYQSNSPKVISVDRVTGLKKSIVHGLGGTFNDETFKGKKFYSGYASLLASECFSLNCTIEKYDYEGTKPRHANLSYPSEDIAKCAELAQQLAVKAEFHSPQEDHE